MPPINTQGPMGYPHSWFCFVLEEKKLNTFFFPFLSFIVSPICPDLVSIFQLCCNISFCFHFLVQWFTLFWFFVPTLLSQSMVVHLIIFWLYSHNCNVARLHYLILKIKLTLYCLIKFVFVCNVKLLVLFITLTFILCKMFICAWFCYNIALHVFFCFV